MTTFRFTPLRRIAVTAAIAAVIVVTVGAQGGRMTMRPEEVPWPAAQAGGAGTSGAGGIETVVVKGDPTRPGLYTLMLRVAPNVRIQAHSHRDDRIATVVKGTWYFGYGETFNEAALQALGPGSLYAEPPNVPHFAMTKEQVVLQITGVGPTATTYVDPKNDPTKK
ncbi:MAG: cupin domain-containing protein [Acidobacteria bacterium]|nr:cupin domain-containing protein [Acidobacteriota bacterium]